MLEADMTHFKDLNCVVMGDFNADINRNKRFDGLLRNFLVRAKLELLTESSGEYTHTYSKGSYSARIDHILANSSTAARVINHEVLNWPECLSDHNPVACTLSTVDKNPNLAVGDEECSPKVTTNFPGITLSSERTIFASLKIYVKIYYLNLKACLMLIKY